MSGQGRPGTVFLFLVLVSVPVPSRLAAQTIDWPRNIAAQDDCELTDVYFRDRETGWVIGRRGLLLMTVDGGRSWEEQTLEVDCDLETICFASPSIGWIAGGYRLPHAAASRGVLLETSDGGTSWQTVPGLDIPRIRKLLFDSARDGFAIGDSGPGNPGGILISNDGGRSWSGSMKAEPAAWQAAERFPDQRLVLASRNGQIALAQNGLWNPTGPSGLAAGAINDFCVLDPHNAMAAGDRGLVAQTADGGRSWQPVDAAAAWPDASVDFQVIVSAGNRIWMGGDPGGLIFRLEPGNRRWSRHPLPIRSPITGMHFIDEQTGWAVSRLGDIIHTGDGGETWSLQRRRARGVALLQLAADAGGFCPEFFAKFCGDEGYVGGAILISSADASPSRNACDDAGQALTRVGASFLVQAPSELLTPESAQSSPDPRLREYLVRQIRCLQPRVIAVDAGGGRQKAEFDLRNQILAAVNDAADPGQFEHQCSGLELPAWQVGKVILIDRSGSGATGISGHEYLTRMACLVGDYAAPSRHLLGQTERDVRAISIQTLYSSPLVAGRSGSLMDSIERLDGQVPKRRQQRPANGNMISMRQLASKTQRLDTLLELAAQPDSTTGQFARGLANLCGNLDDATAGVWLYELGQLCLQRGDTAFARFAFSYLLDQYRRHPLALAAALQLYDDFSSTEMAMLARTRIEAAYRFQQDHPPSPAANTPPLTRPVTHYENGIATTVWEAVVDESNGPVHPVRQVNFLETQLDRLSTVRHQQAYSSGQTVTVFDSGGLDNNQRILSRIRLNQKLEPTISLEDQLKQVAAVPPEQSIVASAALRELAVERQGTAAAARRFGFLCPVAGKRPWLDGKLDDPVWNQVRQDGRFFSLADAAVQVTDQVMIACDDEFLFVAITCAVCQACNTLNRQALDSVTHKCPNPTPSHWELTPTAIICRDSS